MKKLLNYDDKDQSCWLTIKVFIIEIGIYELF